MKRLGREYDKLETLNLFSLLQPEQKLRINDPEPKTSFLEKLGLGLDRALNSESTLHGIGVQTMFQLMVASFGEVLLIKQEDSGECYYSSDDLFQVPDLRVVQGDGTPLLVETKNHYHKRPNEPLRLREADLDALLRYSNLLQTPLKVGIYWTRWNLWTLNDPRTFIRGGRHAQIDLPEAMKTSEMGALGDVTLGTKCPLVLRLCADTEKPRLMATEREFTIQIRECELYCAGQRIDEELEKNIAFYFMMFGSWPDIQPTAEFDSNGLPTAILYTFEPEDIQADQGFEMIGSLSSMFSSFYNGATLQDSRVARLLHYDEPGRLAPIIPPDYKGKALPLWRFIVRP